MDNSVNPTEQPGQAPEPSQQKIHKNNKLNLSIDLRFIAIVLLTIIVVMLAIWRPWQANLNNDESRTVTVTGESKITAEPDEFVFYPSYQFKNANKDAALVELTKKSDEVVGKLKGLGVPDDKIKTDSDGFNYDYYFDPGERLNNYTLRLTVTVASKEVSQKVQDYLLTTGPLDRVSPTGSFSDVKRKELESKARDEATSDARAKADQSAKNLGFKVGSVKTINDSSNQNDVYPLLNGAEPGISQDSSPESKAGLSIQPGQNDLTYSVTVVYYVK